MGLERTGGRTNELAPVVELANILTVQERTLEKESVNEDLRRRTDTLRTHNQIDKAGNSSIASGHDSRRRLRSELITTSNEDVGGGAELLLKAGELLVESVDNSEEIRSHERTRGGE